MYTEEQVKGILDFLKETVSNLRYWHLNDILEHIKSPQVIQAIIDHDILSDSNIYHSLASNSNISSEMLVKLYEKAKTLTKVNAIGVLENILANPNVTADFVLELLRSGELDEHLGPYNSLVSRIAANSNLPLKVIRELTMHLSQINDMATVLSKRRDTIDSNLVEYIYNKMKHISGFGQPFGYVSDFARVKNTPGYILEALYKKHYKYDVRMLFARNPNTPSHILAELAFDKHKDVRAAALANVHTPPETLSKAAHIAASRNIKNAKLILETIIGNPSCPKEVLLDLAMYHNKHIATAARQALERRQGAQLAPAV